MNIKSRSLLNIYVYTVNLVRPNTAKNPKKFNIDTYGRKWRGTKC